MRDPDKYSWFKPDMHVPARRAPRLPRDHFAMQPKLSKTQRCLRAFVVLAVIVYVVALWHR